MKNSGNIFLYYSVAFVTLLCLASPASAGTQDKKSEASNVKEPEQVESASNWNGVYFGPQIGFGINSISTIFPATSYYNTTAPRSFSDEPKGLTGGAHLGFNYQIHSIVLGLEAAYDNGNVKDKDIGVLDPTYTEDRFTTEIKRIGSLNARLGYAKDKWLFYALGGYKTATVEMQIISGNPGPGIVSRDEDNQDGWNTGLGFEYKITPKISLGLQYELSHLDNGQFMTTASNNSPVSASFNDIELSMITARVSFKLF